MEELLVAKISPITRVAWLARAELEKLVVLGVAVIGGKSEKHKDRRKSAASGRGWKDRWRDKVGMISVFSLHPRKMWLPSKREETSFSQGPSDSAMQDDVRSSNQFWRGHPKFCGSRLRACRPACSSFNLTPFARTSLLVDLLRFFRSSTVIMSHT